MSPCAQGLVSPVTQKHLPHSTSHVRELRAALWVVTAVGNALPSCALLPKAPQTANSTSTRAGQQFKQKGEKYLPKLHSFLGAVSYPKLTAYVQGLPRIPTETTHSIITLKIGIFNSILKSGKGNSQRRTQCHLWVPPGPNCRSAPKLCWSYCFSSLGFGQVLIFFHLSNLLDLSYLSML